MNWWQRHLNWAYTVILLGYYVACMMGGVAVGLIAPYAIDGLSTVISIGLWLVIMIPASVWVLRAKGRSLWWLLLAGWLSPLWLANRKREVWADA